MVYRWFSNNPYIDCQRIQRVYGWFLILIYIYILCWISSVVFVRCTPLALSAGKKRKIEKFSFFLSLPERMCCTFFSAYLFPAKNGKNPKKKLFFFLCLNARVFFFVSAYLFPAKKREKSKKQLFFFLCPAGCFVGWLAGLCLQLAKVLAGLPAGWLLG